MAVNKPSPRVQPEDKVCLHCHKSMATCAICDVLHEKGPLFWDKSSIQKKSKIRLSQNLFFSPSESSSFGLYIDIPFLYG